MVILLQQKNFGPNVIYFALGITEGCPAGAFWAEKNVKNENRQKLISYYIIYYISLATIWENDSCESKNVNF